MVFFYQPAMDCKCDHEEGKQYKAPLAQTEGRALALIETELINICDCLYRENIENEAVSSSLVMLKV
jgi:hypothetical protein